MVITIVHQVPEAIPCGPDDPLQFEPDPLILFQSVDVTVLKPLHCAPRVSIRQTLPVPDELLPNKTSTSAPVVQ